MNTRISDPAHPYHTYTRGNYIISTDPARLDVDAIHGYLSRSYWANLRPRATVELSLRHSLNFGIYYAHNYIHRETANLHNDHDDQDAEQGAVQVGLARIITDYATFAYLCDVYILEEHRGQGLGKWLIHTMINDPALKNVVRIMLATRDAHGLYAQYGFVPFAKPENWMERVRTT